MTGTNTIINNQTTPFIVNGNLADDELRDIKGFQAIVVPDWIWWTLLVIVLSFLAWFVYNYIKNRQEEVKLTFAELTIKKIEELDLKKKSKEFYLEYSELIRSYLETRLSMHVLDKTAEEIRPLLVAEHRIMTTQAVILGKIFYRADLAKFAKQEFSSDIKARDIEASVGIIKTIENCILIEEEKRKENELRGLEDAVR